MFGYKAFNDDLTCKRFQYEIGKTYEMIGTPKCCFRGFHFCRNLDECFNYYYFGSRICRVESLGLLDTEDEEKFCTNKIKILEELSFEEICDTIGISTTIGRKLIKSFELSKEFYGKECTLLYSCYGTNNYDLSFFWYINYNYKRVNKKTIGARLSKDFERIEFFRWNDFSRVLFVCNDEEIYQVSNLMKEDLEWFEYLRDNL